MVVVLVIWVFVVFSLQTQVLVTSTCNSDDFKGLMGFMNALESPIDGWWSVHSSCCNWTGITCDPSSGRIVKLQLPNKMLFGHFSDSIFYLDKLTTLNISHNFLKGPLPVSLFHLANLEQLDLSSNKFYGALPLTINLPALRVLDISDNNFTGFLPVGLCGYYFVTCLQINQDSPQTLESGHEIDDDEFVILWLLVLIGFGSGFLLSVISLLVVPRISAAIDNMDKFRATQNFR